MQFYLVDAFSESAFGGNPAAVVFTPAALDERLYLKYSSEFKQSETAFLCPIGDQDFKSAARFKVNAFG